MAAINLTTTRATEGQVSLQKESVFPPTRPEDVFGCLAYTGAPKSIDEMAAGDRAGGDAASNAHAVIGRN